MIPFTDNPDRRQAWKAYPLRARAMAHPVPARLGHLDEQSVAVAGERGRVPRWNTRDHTADRTSATTVSIPSRRRL